MSHFRALLEPLVQALSHRENVLGLAVVLISFVIALSKIIDKGDIPLLGKEYGNSEQRRKAFLKIGPRLYQEGYEKFKNRVFRLTTVDGTRMVVPNSALDELRRLPKGQIDNEKALSVTTESSYTKLAGTSDFLSHVVRSDLTRNLNRINPRLGREVNVTVDSELGPCPDWTNVAIHEKLLRMVAIVSGHIFLGPSLCRREEYLHASINYTIDVFKAVKKLKTWNRWLRPLGQFFTPELKLIVEHRDRAREFLLPIIKERQRDAARSDVADEPDDMLQWMMKKAQDYKLSDEDLADIQLQLSLAAIHTTTMAALSILSQLVLLPEVVDDLREEVRRVMADNEGELTTHALFEMKLLDSVMRETQRCNPSNEASFPRYVNKAVTLSNGQHIPAGIIIETPHGPITRDPQLYPNPDKFDAYRFVKLRNFVTPDPIEYKNREQYQFIAVTKENMHFGYGPNACPGRFFAANEIKLILARILLQYEFRLPPGTEPVARVKQGGVSQPNPRVQIEFRKVKS